MITAPACQQPQSLPVETALTSGPQRYAFTGFVCTRDGTALYAADAFHRLHCVDLCTPQRMQTLLSCSHHDLEAPCNPREVGEVRRLAFVQNTPKPDSELYALTESSTLWHITLPQSLFALKVPV
jgi:hypothetical protein